MKYRNTNNLISNEGIEVEAGSLWKQASKMPFLVLVDDDQYITAPLDNRFKPA